MRLAIEESVFGPDGDPLRYPGERPVDPRLVQGTRKTIDNLALAVWTKAGGEWRLLAYAPTPLPA